MVALEFLLSFEKVMLWELGWVLCLVLLLGWELELGSE